MLFRSNEREVEFVRSDDPLDPGDVGAPANELNVRAGPMGVAPGQENDGLEQARLARRIGSPQELRATTEPGAEVRVTAQVGQSNGRERDGL